LGAEGVAEVIAAHEESVIAEVEHAEYAEHVNPNAE
jgi:hypothetical protein